MIRHCVFIRFKTDTSSVEKNAIYADIAALKAHIPGLLAVHAGANVSPETGMDKGYGDGFIVDFANAHARDAYLEDAEHAKVGARIIAASIGGANGIFVFDIEAADIIAA